MAVTSLSATEYHVSKAGHDGNSGSSQSPFRTISAAAKLAQPGDQVIIHEGVYREQVNPLLGGTSNENRIVYQSASDENVIIKGSEIIRDWQPVQDDTWKVTLPNSFFVGFNPYDDVIGGEWHHNRGYPRHTGAVYLDGDWLDEARDLEQLLPPRKPVVDGHGESEDRVLAGQTANYAGKAVEGTDENTLYQSCRYNLTGYRLSVPNGVYRVTLKFCEPHFSSAAKRFFDVKLQGKRVLRELDIFAKVGAFAAHDETFAGIEVTDGIVKIDIVNRESLGCISGIVIECEGYDKRINCGGPAWKGYLADPASAVSVAHDRPLWYAKVDAKNTTIWAQFKGVDPNVEMVEINVRQSVFYPEKAGRNYITVRGLTLCQAATPWSGAMSEQIGLIGTHWSKGWIIDDNVISHSMNTGITLGRYDLGKYGVAMPAVSAPGFVESCELALVHGWSKQRVGSHVVRNNHISHCEKNGLHGSLGGIFCTIEGNTICDIATRGWIGGPDVAGLKLLASHDTLIQGNHIYRCGGTGGIWLDWMAQGTRMTANLLHDNSKDLFVEVSHGPLLVDNNLLLSNNSLQDWSQGVAYAHNLIAGTVGGRKETRETPFFKPHSVKDMQLSDIQYKDLRFLNNMFVGANGLSAFDTMLENLQAIGNVYLAGAKSSTIESDPLVVGDLEPILKFEERSDGWWLEMPVALVRNPNQKPIPVATKSLGKAKIPNARFEQPDGTPYRIDTDYSGRKRDLDKLSAGPFENSGKPTVVRRVWPRQ